MLLYGHYDVVPAGDETKWSRRRSRRPSATARSTAAAAADSKSNILVHVGALRAWGGRPPVGIKIVIEGQGGGRQRAHDLSRRRSPELFAADAMVIADMGSVRPGVPTLTVGLRGMAA